MGGLLGALKALADESRLKILWILEERALCVCEIQAVLGLAQSTVSRHLQVLEEAGYVVSERAGPWKNYRLASAPPPVVQALTAQARLAATGLREARRLRRLAAQVCREELCAGKPAA
ncbi:MAG: hypothetical protein Kow0092_14940 [Deferrisomatales bacterium]